MSAAVGHLLDLLKRGGATQLGVGPMSVHCVDAVIELANTVRMPLMLIASRRQVECASKGGGYVNGWSTETFAQYVRKRDRGGYVILCRDHGGPWQNYQEVNDGNNLDAAMKSAKESIHVDIQAGFDIIHLDPSIDIHQPPTQEQILERLFDLYEDALALSGRLNAGIEIEIGSEEQSGANQEMSVFVELLRRTDEHCRRNSLQKPLFVVAQTGTLVKETSNVGSFDDPFRRRGTLPAEIQVPALLDICRKHGVHLKEHNADYLSNEALVWHPRLGIHAINIAPELGVGQTRHLIRIGEEFGLHADVEAFLQLSYESGKWTKWMLPNSKATDRDRAIIAGHYLFSDPAFQEIEARIRLACSRKGLDLDQSIRDTLKLTIMRMMACLGLSQA